MANADTVMLELESFTEDITKDLMISLRKRLSSSPPVGTPRDTTFATSNWLLSVRRPSERIVGSKDRISTAGERTERLLRTWKMMSGPIYCVNNVPYIGTLNKGHSKQSPAGFVERAFSEIKAKLNRRKSP